LWPRRRSPLHSGSGGAAVWSYTTQRSRPPRLSRPHGLRANSETIWARRTVSAPALLALTFAFAQAAAETVPAYVYAPKWGDGRASLRDRLASFFWAATAYMLPLCFALLVAQLIPAGALDAFVWAATALALAHTLYLDNRRASSFESSERSESEGFSAGADANANGYYAAFNYTAIGMAVLSANGTLLWVNRSLCIFLGYTGVGASSGRASTR
jgi:PAS domain-containing protein